MSRCRLDYQRALAKHPSLVMVNDGPGFPGFVDAVQSVEKHKPDLIMVFRPNGIPRLEEVNLPKIRSYNETDKGLRLSDEARTYNIRYHILHHPEQVDDLKQHLGPEHHFRGILHAVDPMHYFGAVDNHRPYDILVAGCMAKEIYPFRHRLKEIVEDMKDLNVHVYRHPGYRINEVEKQRDMYCDALRKSKIVIGCTSIYKYPLFKHLEAAACGAIMASDLPKGHAYDDLCIRLDPEMSDAEIRAELRGWLQDDSLLRATAKKAQAYVLGERTTQDYANQFVFTLKDWGFKV